jgi:hypothetical protein
MKIEHFHLPPFEFTLFHSADPFEALTFTRKKVLTVPKVQAGSD